MNFIFRVVSFCLIIIASCTGFAWAGMDAPADAKVLTIPGTGDSQQLLRVLAEAFNARPDAALRVVIPPSIGSSGGINAVLNNKAELARVARPLKESEQDKGLKFLQFASSPVVFTGNVQADCVPRLTISHVLRIYSGTITTYDELGCGTGKLYPLAREVGDSSRTTLEKGLPGFDNISPLAGKVYYTTPDMVKALVDHTNTFGFVPYSAISNTSLVPFPLDGITLEIENEDDPYSLTTPYGFVYKGELSFHALQFVKFVMSDVGIQIIHTFGCHAYLHKGGQSL